MSLLSNAQFLQIRTAIRSVTDTFMKQPIVYRRKGESLDRFNEDRGDEEFVDITLDALVEYGVTESSKLLEREAGATERGMVTVTVNMDYMKGLGLINVHGVTDFSEAEDYMVVDGDTFKVKRVLYDGQLKDDYVLCVIVGVIDKF